mgnify:CR=1 FL=1|jgi:hypothetical protein
MNRSVILNGISFLIYLFFQVIILKNSVLFGSAFCFLYIGYLLLLPVETNPLWLMFIGFGMGLFIDMFYDSAGIHASASVAVMFIRNFWLARVTPQGGYDNGAVPSLASDGLQWFLIYATPMIFVHHALLFFIEAGGFQYVGFTLLKVIFSTLYTMVVILIVQYLFPGERRI